MNASEDKSGRSSRCIALDVAHVNRQMYVLAVPLVVFVNNGPVKSTPTCVKAGTSVTLVSGRSVLLECSSFLQMMH